jgi:hypothetical protein
MAAARFICEKNLVTFLKWFAAFLAAAIGGFGTITPAMSLMSVAERA